MSMLIGVLAMATLFVVFGIRPVESGGGCAGCTGCVDGECTSDPGPAVTPTPTPSHWRPR